MGIKSILSIALSLIVLLNTGCGTLERRPQPGTPPVVIDSKTEEPQAPPKPGTAQVPEFVSHRAPKVGVIFGPGGAKTFAHIGVLQEMERYKIPIVAVAGLEWGALVGSLYALNAQSHEVDWKMSRLPKQNFPTNLFSQKMKSISSEEYDRYFQKIFQSAKIESSKLPFACPGVKGSTGKVALSKSGTYRAGLSACMYYPPIFEVRNNMAAPFAISEAAEFLRQKGADLVILVDVLGAAEKKDFSSWSEDFWGWFSWIPVQSALSQAKSVAGVHEVIRIDASAYSMFDLDQRLRLIQVGKQGSASTLDRMAKKYDF